MVFTQFNFSFITFPRQAFVKIIDCKMPLDMAKEFNTSELVGNLHELFP